MYKYCPEKKKKLQNNSYINKNRFNQFNNCFFTFLKKIFFFFAKFSVFETVQNGF